MAENTIEVDLETEEEIDWLAENRPGGSGGTAWSDGLEANAAKEVASWRPERVYTNGDMTAEAVGWQLREVTNLEPEELQELEAEELSGPAALQVRDRVAELLASEPDEWGPAELENAIRTVRYIEAATGEDAPDIDRSRLLPWGFDPDKE